ncbi:MAG TPA: site-2 protease family protein [Geothermobacteraceae bacterium]|nr:site-2 protease family protein [Geothermobacteraceae bacterium]
MEHLIAKISIMLVPGLFAITLHEVAHGFVAEKFGDPTARMLGRLSLNPLKHLDVIGTIALMVFGFGWAKPVPVNFGNLRKPKRDMIWVALAGPAANLLLAIVSALLLRGLLLLGSLTPEAQLKALSSVLNPLLLMSYFSLYINVLLGVFNLMPLPPFDGGRVMVGLLPARQGEWLSRFEPFGFIIILLLIFYTPVWPVINHLVVLLSGPAVSSAMNTIPLLINQ